MLTIMPRKFLLTTILYTLFLALLTGQMVVAGQSFGAQLQSHSECRQTTVNVSASTLLAEPCSDQQADFCPVVCVSSGSCVQTEAIPVQLSTRSHSGLMYAARVITVSFKPLLRPPIG